MATPGAAASAALVRQYFLEGWHPSGGPNPSDALTPSAALVKAVLLGGAQGMGGFDDYSGMPLTPPPSFGQGYGRVHLGRSLHLANTPGAPRLRVLHAVSIVEGG
jgi:hypothetical protein